MMTDINQYLDFMMKMFRIWTYDPNSYFNISILNNNFHASTKASIFYGQPLCTWDDADTLITIFPVSLLFQLVLFEIVAAAKLIGKRQS